MNAKQQIHNATLNEWLTIFKDQAASGQTIKTWCADHNLSINAYYYWKRIAKESYLDSVGPDIVPVSLPIATPSKSTKSLTQVCATRATCPTYTTRASLMTLLSQ